MTKTPRSEFNQKQLKVLKKAKLVSWVTIAYFGSVVILMFLVMGKSQAMKTTWTEDMLSLIPPINFLIGCRFCQKKPTQHFPYGFHRVVSVGFFFAAAALLLMGSFLFIDGLIVLLSREHPGIGQINIFGHFIWLGWLMIIVMIWGTVPSLFLGRIKLQLSKKIFDKILYTDAEMNRDDWLVGIVVILAIIAIGWGIWWADALGGMLISINVLADGIKQTKESVINLIDSAPKSLTGKYLSLGKRIKVRLKENPLIEDANVKLRDQGHIIFGEIFLKLKGQSTITAKQLNIMLTQIYQLDWRLQNLVITIQ